MSKQSSRSGPAAADDLAVHLTQFIATLAKAGYAEKTRQGPVARPPAAPRRRGRGVGSLPARGPRSKQVSPSIPAPHCSARGTVAALYRGEDRTGSPPKCGPSAARSHRRAHFQHIFRHSLATLKKPRGSGCGQSSRLPDSTSKKSSCWSRLRFRQRAELRPPHLSPHQARTAVRPLAE